MKVVRALAINGILITAILSTLFAVSYLLSFLFGFPLSLALPIAVRIMGGAILLAGLLVVGWVFRHRRIANVISSTYVTFTKMFGRALVAERTGRTEPLIVSGPQKYMRSPLYFGVVVMVLGLALLTAYAFLFTATVVLLLWFGLILVPFEERELHALFGEEWSKYSNETPMLIPFTKRRKRFLASLRGKRRSEPKKNR